MSKQFYWVGWEVDDDIPQEHMLESWPENMKGWRTGLSDTHETYTGMVWARDAEEALDTVRHCYGTAERAYAAPRPRERERRARA